MPNDKLKSYIHLHFIVFIWGFTAVLGKLISLEALNLVWYRIGLALLFIFGYLVITKKSFRLSKKLFLGLFFSGFVIAAHWFTFYEAIKVSNISITLACLSTGSFFTSLLEPILYRQKINWLNVFMGLFVILGLYFVAFAPIIDEYGFADSFQHVFQLENSRIQGVYLALTCAFLSALFSVINGNYAKKYDPTVISLYELFGGFMVLSVYMFFTNKFDTSFFQLSLSDWFWLLILASICTAYAFSASIKVMKHLTPYTVMLTINLEPVYGIILAVLIFSDSEKMHPLFYVGATIIILTVLLNGFIKNKKVNNL